MKPRVLQLVDDESYVKQNCFQHQLHETLSDIADVELISIDKIAVSRAPGDVDSIISTLKQRTAFQHVDSLQRFLRDKPYSIYDQDPWNAYMDDSPYKGAYDVLASKTNVRTFAVTTKWWSEFIIKRGLPSDFVKMWMLPRYCDTGKPFTQRKHHTGFIGQVHGHRKAMFDFLKTVGVNVVHAGNGFAYNAYLDQLADIGVYVHSEDRKLMIDGQVYNLDVGLWAREIEVTCRGCFSIRNTSSIAPDDGAEFLKNIPTAVLYDDIKQVPELVARIDSMPEQQRQHLIAETVSYIKNNNAWRDTAELLVRKGMQ